MKTLKKIICILFLLSIMMLSVVGCGKYENKVYYNYGNENVGYTIKDGKLAYVTKNIMTGVYEYSESEAKEIEFLDDNHFIFKNDYSSYIWYINDTLLFCVEGHGTYYTTKAKPKEVKSSAYL